MSGPNTSEQECQNEGQNQQERGVGPAQLRDQRGRSEPAAGKAGSKKKEAAEEPGDELGARACRPEDLFEHQTISAVDAQPAHAIGVCAVLRADREGDRYRSALWLLPLDGSPPRQLTSGTDTDQDPRLSPDGEQVAFSSDRHGGEPQIHLIALQGGEAWQLSQFDQGVTSFLWAPDGDRLLVTCPVAVDPDRRGRRSDQPPPRRQPGAPEVVWRLPSKMDGMGYTLDKEEHLFTIDLDGHSRRLTDGPFDVRSACWSPDGQHIAYARTREGRLAHRTDIWCMDANGQGARQLSFDHASAASPRWSPDGRWIAFAGAESEGDARYRLWLIEVATGKVSALGSEDLELGNGEELHWLEDSSAVVAVIAQRGLQVLLSIPLSSGQPRLLRGGDRHLSMLAAARGDWLCCSEAADESIEVVAIPRDLQAPGQGRGEERRLTRFNAWSLQRDRPEASKRSFEVPDGNGGTERIEGWLLRPRGAKGPTPLLVDVHGGPTSYVLMTQASHGYWWPLCSQGWSVLALNPVGSSSYGREFAERLNRHWGELDLPQHLAAVDALQKERLTDGRLAIAGKSYGGYLSAWAIGHTRRFHAAIVSAPVTNLESHYGTSDSGFYADPDSMGGVPHEARERHQALSPMKHVHQACTPTLILQGKDDQRCPIGQAEELFTTLMCQAKAQTEMVLYPGGSHHFFERGKPSHRLDAIQRLIEWANRWINVPVDEKPDASSGRGDRGQQPARETEQASAK
jgi:dipeptidyl aminopeptidase/acylaminoacyl peptidase